MQPLKYARLWLVGGLLIVAVIVVVSLAPDLPGPTIVGADKLAHFLMYLVAMLWFVGVFLRANWLRIALLLASLGVLIELLQSQTGWREGDWGDAAWNLAGVLSAIVTAWLGAGGWCVAIERRWLGAGKS